MSIEFSKIKGLPNLSSVVLKNKDEISSMNLIELLDYSNELHENFCVLCRVKSKTIDDFVEAEDTPSKEKPTVASRKICNTLCPLGDQFKMVGSEYESRGKKRYSKPKMTKRRLEVMTKNSDLLSKGYIG